MEVKRQDQSGREGGFSSLSHRAVDATCSATLLIVSRTVRLFFSIPDLLFAMAGAIIENMSTKKLVILGVTLLLFQAFAFMVGGLIGKLFFFFFLTFCLLLLSCVWT